VQEKVIYILFIKFQKIHLLGDIYGLLFFNVFSPILLSHHQGATVQGCRII